MTTICDTIWEFVCGFPTKRARIADLEESLADAKQSEKWQHARRIAVEEKLWHAEKRIKDLEAANKALEDSHRSLMKDYKEAKAESTALRVRLKRASAALGASV